MPPCHALAWHEAALKALPDHHVAPAAPCLKHRGNVLGTMLSIAIKRDQNIEGQCFKRMAEAGKQGKPLALIDRQGDQAGAALRPENDFLERLRGAIRGAVIHQH